MDIRDITNKLIAEIWEDYSNGDSSFKDVSKRYGFYPPSLSKKMRSLGMEIIHRKSKSGKELESQICQLYLTTDLDCVAVSKRMGVSDDIVRASLRRASGNRQVYKFLKWVYNDATIFIERKNKKALEFIKEYESNPRYSKE